MINGRLELKYLMDGEINMDEQEQFDLVDVLTKESILRCFKKFGIEGSLEKIEELCINDTMRECFMRNFYEITGFRRCH
jgi:hypothetical protein